MAFVKDEPDAGYKESLAFTVRVEYMQAIQNLCPSHEEHLPREFTVLSPSLAGKHRSNVNYVKLERAIKYVNGSFDGLFGIIVRFVVENGRYTGKMECRLTDYTEFAIFEDPQLAFDLDLEVKRLTQEHEDAKERLRSLPRRRKVI